MSTETTIFNEGYKPLAQTITRAGITYRQIKRAKSVAMYQPNGRGYEVFKIKLSKGGSMKTKDGQIVSYEPSESFPQR